MKYKGIAILLIGALLIPGCGKEGSDFTFSFNTTVPYNSTGKKVIYFNEDYNNIVLNADLKIDSGSILVQINSPDNEVIWNDIYEESGNYKMELENVTADGEYTVLVQTEQAKKVELQISSPVKLTANKEKPAHI